MDSKYLTLLKDVEPKEIIPGFHGKLVHTDGMTIVLWDVKDGSELPVHSHFHEQISMVLSGEFQMTIDGQTEVLTDGMIVTIPGDVVHSGKALGACKILDVFRPAREEYQ